MRDMHLDHFEGATDAVVVTAPSPVAGEGYWILQQARLGEKWRKIPHPI